MKISVGNKVLREFQKISPIGLAGNLLFCTPFLKGVLPLVENGC